MQYNRSIKNTTLKAPIFFLILSIPVSIAYSIPSSVLRMAEIAKILRQYDFKIIFAPTNKLTLSQLKDPIELSNSWDIYRINCQCGLSYIGQTKRCLKFRIKEHQQYIKKQDINKSSIAKHCWEINHTFDFNSVKITYFCT